MPAAIAAPIIASAIGTGVAGAASIYGAKKQSKAVADAAATSSKADEAALAYAKSQDALSRQDYERYEQNRQPWREASQNALISLSDFAGIPVPQSARTPPRTVPIQAMAQASMPPPRYAVGRDGVPLVAIRNYGR